MQEQLFSETWHDVAPLKVALAPDFRYIKQHFRGEVWYVMEDRFGNRFVRITPEAFAFLNRLSLRQTVGEVWQTALIEDAESTPTQQEVVRILIQLRGYNLLLVEGLTQSEDVFERERKRKGKELRAKIGSFLFIRIPLINPEPWLKRSAWLARLLFNRVTLLIWLVVLVLGGRAVVGDFQALRDDVQGVLSLGNLPLLYVCIFGLKLLHELGHALMTKRFGGTVPVMGIMLLILTPIPYMDASSNWIFRNKVHRILVGGAGMLVELFVAALAALVWVNTGDGVINAVAFNLMFIGSVSSLVFNGNPLLKFDAYYMLSDLLEIPNLYERSRKQWLHWIERYVFGLGKAAKMVGETASEQAWLATYGAASFVYRVLVTVAIILFVADVWLVLGAVLVVGALWAWVLKPVSKYIRYLWTDPLIRRVRVRAVGLTAACVATLLVVIYFVPVVNAVRAPGVVLARTYHTVYSPTDGILTGVNVSYGGRVEAGQTLGIVTSSDLALDIKRLQVQLAELDALLRLAVESRQQDLEPLRERLRSTEQRLEKLRDLRARNHLRAPIGGYVVRRDIGQLDGRRVAAREALTTIVDTSAFEFVAVLSQEDASEVFRHDGLSGQIRLWGRAGSLITSSELTAVPYEQTELPSAALGWKGGGDIPVKADDPAGLETLESYFKVVVPLPSQADGERLYQHNRQGVLRIVLKSEPLGSQLIRRLRQLLQERYRL